MLYDGAIISLLGVSFGALLTIIISRYGRREVEQEQINEILHALYLEVEENLIYCCNASIGQLSLTQFFSEFDLKQAA